MNRLNFSFHPRLLDDLNGYNSDKLIRDLTSGLTVGAVALPLAMAFAIASGVKPEAGIFTAIIAGFLISALGGSRVQIGGPAGAFIVIIYGIVERYGLANLLISTIFAGILLFAMGMFRLGSMIRFIPVTIVIGFTNGIAVLIALSQLKDFFGLNIDKMPGDFFLQIKMLAQHAGTFNSVALAIGAVSLAIIVAWPKIFTVTVNGSETAPPPKKISHHLQFLRLVPGPVVVLILGTIAVSLLDLPVETIGSKFGGIPQNLPTFTLPAFSWELVKQLFAPTLTIALLGAIESLLCARVSDNLTGDRHNPNQELMAQGIANFITPFFGGIPATGTIARTVTNIRTGAASPLAGIVHSLAILAVVLVAAPLAKNIPLATLAAILLLVAYNMGEWHEFVRLRHFSMNYRIIVLASFLLTVIFDLTVAVEIGLFLACMFFIFRISNLTSIEPIPATTLEQALPPGVAAYAIFGSLFFGAVDKLERLIAPEVMPDKALVLELHQLINIDTTGLDTLEMLHKSLQKRGSQLILCGLNHQPLDLMKRARFLERVGMQNVVSDLPDALARARQLTA